MEGAGWCLGDAFGGCEVCDCLEGARVADYLHEFEDGVFEAVGEMRLLFGARVLCFGEVGIQVRD